MELVNLQVQDVILHEVFKRGNDQARVQPEFGDATEDLTVDALDALRDRIVAAMTSSTRCVLMTIKKASPESMVSRVAASIDADEALYIQESCGIAEKLADEQKARNIPGGVVVVFRGTAGAPARRLVGVIKAEVHNGFVRDKADGGKATLKFLTSLMLTAQTKLYKIGLFLETSPAEQEKSKKWSAYIYDEMLTMSNRYDAAKYFYDGFLGLQFPESSARQTSQFHEFTKSFIQSMNVAEEEKVVLHNALVTYLKADQTPTVGTMGFAEAYFGDPDIQDAYSKHMTAQGFPNTPINKDLSDLDNALRLRRLNFHNKIRVVGPAAEFEKLVKIDLIDGDRDEKGAPAKWTQLTIKDRISGQD